MKALAQLLLLVGTCFELSQDSGAKVGGKVTPDGSAQIQLDLPDSLKLHNKGGRDGLGLCVFTSCNHSAFWQNIPLLQDLRDYMTKQPGGGWPEKVTQYVQRIAKERGESPPHFLNVETRSRETALAILRLACKTGRMPGITYSYSPSGRYGGARISHMVSLAHLDDKWAGVLDNNYEHEIEWLTIDEFWRTHSGGGTAWSVIFLGPAPPPVATNQH